MVEGSGRLVGSVFWSRIMFLDGPGLAEFRFWKVPPRTNDQRCPPFPATVGAAPPIEANRNPEYGQMLDPYLGYC